MTNRRRPRFLPQVVALLTLGATCPLAAADDLLERAEQTWERTAAELREETNELRAEGRRFDATVTQPARRSIEQALDRLDRTVRRLRGADDEPSPEPQAVDLPVEAEQAGLAPSDATRTDLGGVIPWAGSTPESFEEVAGRAERLAAVPVRVFDALPNDPERAKRELRRGLDPTDVNSPLRALTRNDVLDLYQIVDWLAPYQRKGFTAVRPGVDADGRPIAIQYTDSPIVYINGALTTRGRAVEAGQALADRLGAVVLVWHNETNGILGDAAESLLNLADVPLGAGGELRTMIDRPQPITVIGHSQGAAQLHAVLTDRQRRGLSNAHVAAVMLGAPNGAETRLKVGKWTYITHGDDIVPNVLGRNRLGGNLADHSIDYYLPLVEPGMLW
ncbi:hypothetical protein [Alienimonas chondri]|uniref:Alpha/beta hydrolase family protein n=1 Tax=Alienimonas chondri TaxID=2681879 RepID=A0ABX1VHA2_9PLAN|nr:hypothetical protein [Alienimonas chondri]NNJ27461.1 hypothetical protein [Alienimonas chondri]